MLRRSQEPEGHGFAHKQRAGGGGMHSEADAIDIIVSKQNDKGHAEQMGYVPGAEGPKKIL